MSFYDELSSAQLLDAMFSRLTIDKNSFLTSIGFSGNVDLLIKTFNLDMLSNAEINDLKNSIENFLNTKSYFDYLKDDEDEEYVLHTGRAFIRKCDQKLNDRQPRRTS